MAPPAQSGRNRQARRRPIVRLQHVVRLRRCYAARTAQRAVPTQVGPSRCDGPARAERAEQAGTTAGNRPEPERRPIAPLLRGADGAARHPYHPRNTAALWRRPIWHGDCLIVLSEAAQAVAEPGVGPAFRSDSTARLGGPGRCPNKQRSNDSVYHEHDSCSQSLSRLDCLFVPFRSARGARCGADGIMGV